MDHAHTGLEIGAQSVRHPVRRQGAGVNTSYTVNLTPPTGGGLADSRNFQAVQEISVQQMQLVFLLSFLPYLPD